MAAGGPAAYDVLPAAYILTVKLLHFFGLRKDWVFRGTQRTVQKKHCISGALKPVSYLPPILTLIYIQANLLSALVNTLYVPPH